MIEKRYEQYIFPHRWHENPAPDSWCCPWCDPVGLKSGPIPLNDPCPKCGAMLKAVALRSVPEGGPDAAMKTTDAVREGATP